MLDPDISTEEALALLHLRESDPHMLDRRRFLQLIGMGLGAGLVAGSGGSVLDKLLLAGTDPSAWAGGPSGAHDGGLGVIGVFRRNDGVNPLLPFGRPALHQEEGRLGVGGNPAPPIGAGLGLNPALTELKSRWDAGQLAVVQ